jgi:Phage integrase family
VRVEWFRHGLPRSEWVFPSVTGTPLDASNVRKALNQILDKAELHRRGPHQMRQTFASLLLQAGVPITYVSRQLGHKDSAITLRVDAHWLPEFTAWKGVDWLDDARPSATPAQPERKIAVGEHALSPYGAMVTQISTCAQVTIHFSKMSTKPASPDAPLRACAARAKGVLSGLTLS